MSKFHEKKWEDCKKVIERTGEFLSPRHAKRYLLEKEGHQCSICKSSKWMGLPIPLICDHMDGDHSNRKVSNFRLVCPNCDAQLPTFKSKNRKPKVGSRAILQAERKRKAAELALSKSKPCPVCSKVFVPVKSRQIVCSNTCRFDYVKSQSRNCGKAYSLEETLVKQIKRLRSKGMSSYKIADQLSIARNTVMKYWN